jgi:DNA-binding NtrC family response regulator
VATVKRVLFVDDEPQVLKGIERTLRGQRNHWELAFAANADQALTLMERRPADVMVTDIRMPGMHGDALIEQVDERFPGTVSMALSGQCSQEQAIAISRRGVRFLAKPCDGVVLVSAITEAFVYQEKLTQSSLPQAASHADLHHAVLVMAAAMVKGGLLQTDQIPDSLRGIFMENISPAAIGLLTGPPTSGDNGGSATTMPDPDLDELRRRLGIVAADDAS